MLFFIAQPPLLRPQTDMKIRKVEEEGEEHVELHHHQEGKPPAEEVAQHQDGGIEVDGEHQRLVAQLLDESSSRRQRENPTITLPTISSKSEKVLTKSLSGPKWEKLFASTASGCWPKSTRRPLTDSSMVKAELPTRDATSLNARRTKAATNTMHPMRLQVYGINKLECFMTF